MKLKKEHLRKLTALAILIVIALLSVTVIAKPLTAPETYTETIRSIDEKKATVMGLTAATATASSVIAVIPGDATTPIANQIMEMSSYLLIVVCVLVLEKSLLTVMGYLSCYILIPLACLLFAIFLFWKKNILKELAIKFGVLSLVLIMIIPLSLKVSDLIYDMNKQTVEEVTVAVEEAVQENSTEEKGWFSSILDKVSDGAKNTANELKKVVNRFIDAIAVFIITYCAIPIIVVLLMMWLVKFLFGIALPGSERLKRLPFNKKSGTE